MHITVSHAFLSKTRSVRASLVMDHFGIDFEQGRHVIASDLELPIRAGDVVLFTGASGSGKSSLMRAAADELQRNAVRTAGSVVGQAASLPDAGGLLTEAGRFGHEKNAVLDIDAIDPGERILIDALPVPSDEALHLLCACGLGEAQLMLRAPAELSDGQRYRFRLALALAQQRAGSPTSVGRTQAESCTPAWLLADEFTATLDRTLAKVVSFNVRRMADRMGVGFLLATTHEDVAEDLAPDVHVRCRLDGEIAVEEARDGRKSESSMVYRPWSIVPVPTMDDGQWTEDGTPPVKKKRSRSPTNSRSPPRPVRTGRISRGGIIGARASE